MCPHLSADKPIPSEHGVTSEARVRLKEVVLPTDFSAAGKTNEIMPFKAMFQGTLIVRDLPIISLCEEWGYPEEKKIKLLSSHPTAL